MGRFGATLFVLGGAALSLAAYRTARTPLEAPAADALAALLQLDRARVSVERARFFGPTLELDGVRAGGLVIGHVEVGFDPIAALGRHLRVRRVHLDDARSPAYGALASLEAHLRGGEARVVVRGVSGHLGGLPVALGELGLEVSGGRLRRLAFERGRLSGLDELAGSALGDANGWLLRAARPGLTFTGRLDGDRLDARAVLDKLHLSPGPLPLGLDLDRASVSGTIELRRAEARLVATLSLIVDDAAIEHRALAPRRIEHLSPRLDGVAVLADGALSLDQVRVSLGPVAVTLDGQLDSLRAFELAAELEPIGCADLLRALPRSLLPALDGLLLDGRLGGRVYLAGAPEALADLALDVNLDVGCRVLGDAPLADVRTLMHPLTRVVDDARGRPRPLLLGPGNASWRPLSSLPDPLVHTFLAAEDGGFYRHHGFDEEMIRRALAADLGAGRFERGASTISQQVVKNLLLSGERTAARKLEEAVLTWRLESVLDKRRILELYLNLVELGPGVYGLTEGAERYFGKEPEELSTDEAAQLAALLPAPRRGMDAAWQRRYQSLKSRLPTEKVPLPPPPIKLTQR